MASGLQGRKMLVIGGGSGIARQLVIDASAAGAEVVVAGRDLRRAADTVADLRSEVGDKLAPARLDLGDEDSIAELAAQLGEIDYLIALGSAPANGPVAQLDDRNVRAAFDAKVIGPILLAKHFGDRFTDGGSVLLFSGIAAWRPEPGLSVMAATNGAVSFLAQALAVELAPVRVNALSPGIVDSGACDGLGEKGKAEMFRRTAEKNPARRVGQVEDIAAAALLLLTNPFITGETVHVDGGGRLA